MNKELYIKTKELKQKSNNLQSTFSSLNKFITKNEKIFKKNESIEALKKIKEYLLNIEKELDISNNECRKVSRELICSCKHEIAIKRTRVLNYNCMVCGVNLGSDISKETLISIDTNNDYETETKLVKIFKDIIYSDKELIDTMNDALEDFQYDSKIKVYRR